MIMTPHQDPVRSDSTDSASTQTITISDQELISQAKIAYNDEKLLVAARLLRAVQDKALISDEFHNSLLSNAQVCEAAIADLLSTPSTTTTTTTAAAASSSNDESWKLISESHGKYGTQIFYKMDASGGARMTCRMDTPISTDLLVPLLSVLNESSLYDSWIPSWKKPIKLGVGQSNLLLNDTRGHQIIQIQCDVPWPMASREVLMDALALDDIEHQGFIAVKLRTLNDNMPLPTGFTIPQLEKNMERIEFDGAILFRACPNDHPTLINQSQKKNNNKNKKRNDEQHSGDMILVSFTAFFDAHMPMVPTSFINFVTRTVIGHIWDMFLVVAEQVRDGKRPDHKAAIDAKQDFYSWVDIRIQTMLQKVAEANKEKENVEKIAQKEGIDFSNESTNNWTLNEVLTMSM